MQNQQQIILRETVLGVSLSLVGCLNRSPPQSLSALWAVWTVPPPSLSQPCGLFEPFPPQSLSALWAVWTVPPSVSLSLVGCLNRSPPPPPPRLSQPCGLFEPFPHKSLSALWAVWTVPPPPPRLSQPCGLFEPFPHQSLSASWAVWTVPTSLSQPCGLFEPFPPVSLSLEGCLNRSHHTPVLLAPSRTFSLSWPGRDPALVAAAVPGQRVGRPVSPPSLPDSLYCQHY